LPFTEQEVKDVIKAAPREKAPGPNGFIGIFFPKCWDVIKEDLLRALHQFFHLNQQCLHFLNQAFVVLLPKKQNPSKVLDYVTPRVTESLIKSSRFEIKIQSQELNSKIEVMSSVD
jgi:hypothetical protein